MFDPDQDTAEFESPFRGVDDPTWADLPPYPTVPADDRTQDVDGDERGPWLAPLLLLAVATLCGFAIVAKLVVGAK